jgi:beta-glucosidase
MSNTGFRDGFVWGCATASYQIEGAAKTDGRGDSVWDLLCRQPGTVYDGHTGEVADDHYNRYQEDVALLKQLGAMGYRFSVSWSRVLPEGVGAVNEKGLAFYDRLVDSLLEAGVAPYVTLFHWDFPTELYYKGGWLNRDSVKWFADYTKVVVDRLSDRVVNWMTLNEPQCFIGMGHESGIHAPGIQLSTEQVLRAGHHALMAHGAAVQTIREHAKKTPAIGYAPVGSVSIPATDSPEDVEAARQAMFVAQSTSFWDNAWWMDPIFFGHYPEASLEQHGLNVPDYTEADMDLIKQPLDFFGVNTYHGQIVKAGVDGVPQVQGFPPGSAHTAVNWPVTPECLYWGPKFFYERYGKPVLITENGIAVTDWPALDGKVHDPQRIDYLHRHLLELRRAYREGVDIVGYLEWSLLDNFEWAEGYKERFGIVFVDYATQQRIPKDSYYWFRDVIASNGANL